MRMTTVWEKNACLIIAANAPEVPVFGILAEVEMESPLREDKRGVRGGQEFSQQEEGCFLLKAVWGHGINHRIQSDRRVIKKSWDKCKGLCLELKLLVIWP